MDLQQRLAPFPSPADVASSALASIIRPVPYNITTHSPSPLQSESQHPLQDCLSLLQDKPSYASSCTMFRKLDNPTSGRFACKELRALCSARLCRLARPSNPLSRYSSGALQPGTNARTSSLLQSVATKRTKGFQKLLNCTP